MERIKILAIIARLIFSAESDGLTCSLDSVIVPPWNSRGVIVDCTGNGKFREFTVLPSGVVIPTTGRTS